MRKEYFILSLMLAALPIASFAQTTGVNIDARVGTTTRVRSVQVETRLKTQADIRVENEARRAELEAQRAKLKAEAEARRAAAVKMGDEMKAQREAMMVEREDKRAEMDAKREAMRVEAEARRAEIQAKRVEIRADVAERKANVTARFISATIERFEKIIVRIESRIAKVKARGGDTGESERLVALAKVDISEAQVSLEAFASVDLSGEDTIKENFERIRALAAEAREHLRAAHQNLILAVRALGAVEVTATTTSSVTQ